MKKALLLGCVVAVMFCAPVAHAGCELATGPCSTDGYGGTYVTKENLGGGYTTYRNGARYSTTQPMLNGNYETRGPGGRQIHNYNPYEQQGRSDPRPRAWQRPQVQ